MSVTICVTEGYVRVSKVAVSSACADAEYRDLELHSSESIEPMFWLLLVFAFFLLYFLLFFIGLLYLG